MSDHDRFDEFLRSALHDARTTEPTQDEITTAVRAARGPAPRRPRGRRLVAVLAGSFALVTGTAFAVPQTRHALTNGFGTLKDFLTNQGDPPGTPIPPGEADGQLNWFRGTDTTNGSIIAETQGTRLVAYRQTTTGMACLAYGTVASVCRPDSEWTTLLRASPVQLAGPLPESNPMARLALFGTTADNISTVTIHYGDGTTEHTDGIAHGFVIFVDPQRRPTTLTAHDPSGFTIATLNIAHRQWKFHR